MRAHQVLAALLVGLLLVGVLGAPVAAQRGLGGKGRHQRQSDPARPEPAAGEYGLDGASAVDAVNRGEGQQALDYYERVARGAEVQGDLARAARAEHAATTAARRLGRYQRAIQSGQRAIELFRRASGLGFQDLGSWVSTYGHLGAAYRTVGDLPRARQMFEEGIELSRTRLSGRREEQAEGYLLNGLARIAYAQHDYKAALARSPEAARFFESAESLLPAKGSERARAKLRRWTVESLLELGRAQLALDHPAEAGDAFDRGLKLAQQGGLREREIDLLAAQGSLALSRQEWTRALDTYRQCVALAGRIQRAGGLASLYMGQSRALAGLGRPEEAFQAAQEAVRHVEGIRADLGDPELRSGFFEDKQGIYQHAIAMAVEGQAVPTTRSRWPSRVAPGPCSTSSAARPLCPRDAPVLSSTRRSTSGPASPRRAPRSRTPSARTSRNPAGPRSRHWSATTGRSSIGSGTRASSRPRSCRWTPSAGRRSRRCCPRARRWWYRIGDSGVVAWVVDRQRFTMVRLPGDRVSLAAEVRRFRAAIVAQSPLAAIEGQAGTLYRRLLEPLRREIRGERVVVVPHAVLHYLPFDALRSPAGRWVVEDFALTTLPSASVLRYLDRKGVGAPESALVVGNPDLGRRSRCPGPSGRRGWSDSASGWRRC